MVLEATLSTCKLKRRRETDTESIWPHKKIIYFLAIGVWIVNIEPS